MRVRLAVLAASATCVIATAFPAAADSVRGTPGPDDVVGTSGPDTIETFGGDDHVRALGGDDVIRLGRSGRHHDEYGDGGAGDDRVFGGRGTDFLSGGPGDDLLRGGPGGDVLRDSGGSDHFYSGTGADQADLGRQNATRTEQDVVHMGPGNDLVLAPSDHQPDLIDCGPGTDDRLLYAHRPDPNDTVRGCELIETIPSGEGTPARPSA